MTSKSKKIQMHFCKKELYNVNNQSKNCILLGTLQASNP